MTPWRLLVLPLLAITLTAFAATAAACPAASHLATDAAFQAIQPEAGIQFVAEGRIGDRSGLATFELDLGQTTSAPATTAQYGWVSGQAEPFTLAYSDVTGLATFTLGGRALQYSPGGTFTDIYIRTRSGNAAWSVVIDNLVLDGCPVGDSSSAVGAALDYLRLQGGSLGDGFTLTGTATLSWTGPAPTQSNLAFQVKVGTPAPPLPVEGTSWSGVKSRF